MRAIDADRLLTDRMKEHYYHLPNGDIAIPIIDIEHAPTIEPKKGRWIEDAETFYKAVNKNGGGVDANTPYFTEDDIACSECLALFNVIDNCTECFDFCPSCGADMREGEADG